MVETPNRKIGIAYMLLSALAASSSGILVRLVEDASAWQILSWRSLAFATMFVIILLCRYGAHLPRAFRVIGWAGFAGALCLGLTYIAYLTSIFMTSVSAAVIIFTLSPFFAGILSALFLKERPDSGTWFWMAIALGGVIIIMVNDPAQGVDLLRPKLGMVMALAAAIGYAVAIVMLRGGRDHDMRPTFVVAGAVAFGISSGFAGTLAIPPSDTLIGITLGFVSLGLQYLFLERAARHLRADELALLALVEVFIAPLWVWIGVGEVPSLSTVVGGCVVIAAVVGLSVKGLEFQKSSPSGDRGG